MSSKRHMYIIWCRSENIDRFEEVLRSFPKKGVDILLLTSEVMGIRLSLTSEEAIVIQLSSEVLDMYKNSKLRKNNKIPKHVLEKLER